MLVVILAVLALLIISTSGAGARLEGKVLADIERGAFEPTPGTTRIVEKLLQQGVVRHVDGVPVVDAEARAARAAMARTQLVRTAVIVVSLTGLVAIATKVLLDRSGS